MPQFSPQNVALNEALDQTWVSMQGFSDKEKADHYVSAIRNVLYHPDAQGTLHTDAFRKARSGSIANKAPVQVSYDALTKAMMSILERDERMESGDKGISSRFERGSYSAIDLHSTRFLRELQEYQDLYPIWLAQAENEG